MKTFQQFNEDIEQRRIAARERTLAMQTAAKERTQAYHDAAQERRQAIQDKLKQDIQTRKDKEAALKQKREQERQERLERQKQRQLQTEQTPSMEQNPYNVMISRQSATWKGRQIRQSHGEMQSKAQSELAAKRARLKALTRG